jgi:predicted esterase
MPRAERFMRPLRLILLVFAAAISSGGSAAQTAAKAPVPEAEGKTLRKLFGQALAAPSPQSAKELEGRARGLAAKYDSKSVLAALAHGPVYVPGEPKPRVVRKKPEVLARFGTVVYGYSFEHEGEIYRYAVDLPKGYDAGKAAPLLVDPGHGSGKDKSDAEKAAFLPFYRRQVDAAGLESALIARTEIVEQIGAGGERGEKPEDEVVRVFDAFFRDIVSRFHVDLDRVWVAGLSQTGFWSWYLGAARADRLAGIAPMSAVTWEVNGLLASFSSLPVAALHGDQDKICPVAQTRKTMAELERLGFPARYQEIAGAGHDVGVWSKLHESLRWLAGRPRTPRPRRVAKALTTLASPWCYWVRIDEIEKAGAGKAGAPPAATLEAAVNGQTITLTTVGVRRLTLALSSELVDFTKPMNVQWNGKPAFTGLPPRDLAKAMALMLERADWRMSFDGAVSLKSP